MPRSRATVSHWTPKPEPILCLLHSPRRTHDPMIARVLRGRTVICTAIKVSVGGGIGMCRVLPSICCGLSLFARRGLKVTSLMFVLAIRLPMSPAAPAPFAPVPIPEMTPTLAALLADEQRLRDVSDSITWRRLLHHYPVRSRVWSSRTRLDNTDFFLSPQGGSDPLAELKATIVELATEASGGQEPTKALGALNLSASCAFPARRLFLQAAIGLKSAVPCPDWQEWQEGIGAKSLSVVFSSSFAGSPSSLFGHTFLKFGRESSSALAATSDFQSNEMLDYALSYGADSTDANPVDLVIKGLGGGFRGLFSVSPFYLKIREYNHAEGRDLWIYDLDLTESEVTLILAHVWELLNLAQFDYYFFDENCSSMLLELIEVAKPEWDLAESFSWAVLPVQSLKAITARPGAVVGTRSRADVTEEFRYALDRLTTKQRHELKGILKGTIDPHNAEGATLIAASRYLEWQRMRQGGRLDDEGRGLRNRTLAALADLTSTASQASYAAAETEHRPATNVPAAEDPTASHGPAKIWAGYRHTAWSTFGRNEALLGWRYGFHNALDPGFGYEPGLDIEYAKIEFAISRNRNRVREVTPIKLESLNHFDAFSHPVSYTLRVSYLDEGTSEIFGEVGLGLAHHITLGMHQGIVYGVLGPRICYLIDDKIETSEPKKPWGSCGVKTLEGFAEGLAPNLVDDHLGRSS